VSLRRLRPGEALAGAAAVGLFAVLFLDWFGLESHGGRFLIVFGAYHLHTTGWSSLGWFVDVLLVASISSALALALLTVSRAAVALSVGAAVLTAAFGSIVAIVLFIRVITQPGLGAGLPNELVDIKAAAWIGVALAALIALGGWISIRDERTASADSAYTPPPPRPAPAP
jgi:hypothetical protein